MSVCLFESYLKSSEIKEYSERRFKWLYKNSDFKKFN